MIVRAAPSAVRQFPGMLSAPLNRYSPLWYPADSTICPDHVLASLPIARATVHQKRVVVPVAGNSRPGDSPLRPGSLRSALPPSDEPPPQTDRAHARRRPPLPSPLLGVTP